MTKPTLHYLNLTLLIIFLGMLWTRLPAQRSSDKPNIVWIVTEDNSKHYLRLYDEGGATMPIIEKLAKNGIVFDRAFSNAPVCSVARSTLISGCYAPRIGAQYHRKMELAPLPDGLSMFPHYLREGGYYTTNNSKEDYNLIKSEDVWDESSGNATYRNRAKGQPFFHVQNFGLTHEGQLHFSEDDRQSTSLQTNPDSVTVFPYHPDTPTFRYTRARYLDLHRKVDEAIGEFLQQLENDGLMENTIIFYYGDHGGVLPRSKGYIYESGVHVPLVLYVPERWKSLVPEGMGPRTDAFVSFVDFGPTVLQLAGIDVPEPMDGKPFLGKGVTQADLQQRNTTFSYADRFDEKYDLVRAFREGNYKYIRSYQPFNVDALYNFYRYKMLAYQEWWQLFEAGELNDVRAQFFLPRKAEALYDLVSDPHETNNLADQPDYQQTLVELRGKLAQQVKSMPDLSFYPEPYFLAQGLADPVQFGQQHQDEISALIDIADLSLVPYGEAKPGIQRALESMNPWKRYWGLIVCSSFGEAAADFYEQAQQIAKNDGERLVQMRALEFLGLNDQPVDTDAMVAIIKEAKTEAEADLLLNTVALLTMARPDFRIKLPKSMFPSQWISEPDKLVSRRIDFINQPN